MIRLWVNLLAISPDDWRPGALAIMPRSPFDNRIFVTSPHQDREKARQWHAVIVGNMVRAQMTAPCVHGRQKQ